MSTQMLFLDAGHAEYVPYAPGVSLTYVYSPMSLDDLPNEDNAQALLTEALAPYNVPADLFTVYDPTWCEIIMVSGTVEALDGAFENLLAQVAVEPSGDDDTFDYWPSGARLLLQFASALDMLRTREGETRVQGASAAIRGAMPEDFQDELLDKIPSLA